MLTRSLLESAIFRPSKEHAYIWRYSCLYWVMQSNWPFGIMWRVRTYSITVCLYLPTLGSQAIWFISFLCRTSFLCGTYVYFAVLTALTWEIHAYFYLWNCRLYSRFSCTCWSWLHWSQHFFFVLIIFDKEVDTVKNSRLFWIVVKCV